MSDPLKPLPCPLCHMEPTISACGSEGKTDIYHECLEGFYIEVSDTQPTREKAIEFWNEIIEGMKGTP